MQCDALITVKLTLGYGKCQFSLATWRLSPGFSPQICAVSRGAAHGTACLRSPHSASNLPSSPPHTPWGAIAVSLVFSSLSEIPFLVLSSSPKTFPRQMASSRSCCCCFFFFFFFLRSSLGYMSCIFHPSTQGKGNPQQTGTDLNTPLFTIYSSSPFWNQ